MGETKKGFAFLTGVADKIRRIPRDPKIESVAYNLQHEVFMDYLKGDPIPEDKIQKIEDGHQYTQEQIEAMVKIMSAEAPDLGHLVSQ